MNSRCLEGRGRSWPRLPQEQLLEWRLLVPILGAFVRDVCQVINHPWWVSVLASQGHAVTKCHKPSGLKQQSVFYETKFRGVWVAQSVTRPTSPQVVISRFVSSSPASGSVRTAQSLEPASDSVSPSLLLPCLCSVSLSLSKINIKKILKENQSVNNLNLLRRTSTNSTGE